MLQKNTPNKKYTRPFPIDLTGQRFGRLSVLSRTELSSTGKKTTHSQWLSQCDCGNKTVSPRFNLVSGRAMSCGCLNSEITSARNTLNTGARKQNAATKMPEYNAYWTMLARCHNVTSTGYKKYGAKGVFVCDAWRESFANFIKDMGPKPSKKHSLDRSDPHGNYTPENCRWVLPTVQARNKRVNKLSPADIPVILERRASGETLKTIAESYGVHLSLISLIARKKVWS